jgi:hypothetical protein
MGTGAGSARLPIGDAAMRALLVFGGRPVVPELDLLVVADTVLSDTAWVAVLSKRPRGAVGSGRVTRDRHSAQSRRCGVSDRPAPVFAELARSSAGGPADYSGASYPRLMAGPALHWSIPGSSRPGTPRLFLDGFGHADGRARFGEGIPNHS